ncbi:unnamed protein product [Rotaria sordida]|uniref:Tetraspanin n=1 Tax=Rotaria sordida TaxID=392033 RepID=A0A815HP74_9BILA|nr:unnamed protein product [Rotaria sordida]
MFKTYSVVCVATNTLSIIVAVALLIAGSICIHDTSFLRSSWTEIYSLSIYSVIISILSIIFALCLIYVVIRKLPALTVLFSVLILIVFVLAIINLIVLAVSFGDLQADSDKTTETLFHNYSNSDLIISSKKLFGEIQQTFHCCGVRVADDWKNQLPDGKSTPDSCCRIVIAGCGTNSLTRQDTIYVHGCAEPIYFYLRQRFIALLTIDTILVILLLASAILGFISEQHIREQYQMM